MLDGLKIDEAMRKYGVSVEHSTVRQIAAKGRAWIVAEVARLKADPRGATPAGQRIIAVSRVAWEVAEA